MRMLVVVDSFGVALLIASSSAVLIDLVLYILRGDSVGVSLILRLTILFDSRLSCLKWFLNLAT